MAAQAPAAGMAGGTEAAAPHALTFRVMRLCGPSQRAEQPLRFTPSDLGMPSVRPAGGPRRAPLLSVPCLLTPSRAWLPLLPCRLPPCHLRRLVRTSATGLCT